MSLQLSDLSFERPAALQANAPPELRAAGRDDVRLLVSTSAGHEHSHFTRLGNHLRPGDLLVVNRSATLPASLPAEATFGPFRLNLSTRYAPTLWLAEPRWSHADPGPLPLAPGERVVVAGVEAHLVAPHAGLERLWFVSFAGDIDAAMHTHGVPIRYAYLEHDQPLERYQTVFADTPGSAEMPSAGRPFSSRVLAALRARGVAVTSLTLHTGVSSLEVDVDDLEALTMYAEPFEVPAGHHRTGQCHQGARRPHDRGGHHRGPGAGQHLGPGFGPPSRHPGLHPALHPAATPQPRRRWPRHRLPRSARHPPGHTLCRGGQGPGAGGV